MRTPLLSLVLAGVLSGCATSGRIQQSAVDRITVGQSTRLELLQWFGDPLSQFYDGDGLALTWAYTRVQSYIYWTDLQQAMLTATFTNDVVSRFWISGRPQQDGEPKKAAPPPRWAH